MGKVTMQQCYSQQKNVVKITLFMQIASHYTKWGDKSLFHSPTQCDI